MMANTPDTPLRIGLMVETLVGGGIERVVLNLFDAFAELGCEVHLFLMTNKIEHDISGVADERLHILSESGMLCRVKWLNRLMLAMRLRAQIKALEDTEQKFAFFISHSKQISKMMKVLRSKNILSVQHSLPRTLRKYYRKPEATRGAVPQLNYRQQHIVTVSQGIEREMLAAGAQPASIRTIYNPIHFKHIRALAAEQGDYPHEPYILYPARFHQRKRHDLLLHAYAQAQVNEKLVLMGRVDSIAEKKVLSATRTLAAELGIESEVIFPGFKQNPYLWIQHASLLALPSDNEGLGMVLAEALALGTPAISTDCPVGPAEILTGELAQFLSPVGDVDAFAHNIRSALKQYPPIDDTMIAKFDHLTVARTYVQHVLQLSNCNTNYTANGTA